MNSRLGQLGWQLGSRAYHTHQASHSLKIQLDYCRVGPLIRAEWHSQLKAGATPAFPVRKRRKTMRRIISRNLCSPPAFLLMLLTALVLFGPSERPRAA